MKKLLIATMVSAVALGAGQQAQAGDDPVVFPPHGMFRVQIDGNNKLFSNSGAAAFDETNNPGLFTTNAAGHTVFGHNVGNSIAEQDGDLAIGNPAGPTSTTLWTDDPGYTANADIFPVNSVLSLNLHNSLRYFASGGTQWDTPLNGEQLRVFDLFGGDDTGGAAADLSVTITGSTSGHLGTINIDNAEPAGGVIMVTGLHGMMGYELTRADSGIPAQGAYMIELTLSATEGLMDSDPIFVVFNNQLGASDFSAAVAAAQTLPEPSTALLVVAVGAGLIGLKRRGTERA